MQGIGTGGLGMGGLGNIAGANLADSKIVEAQRLERAGETEKAAKDFEKLLAGIMVKQMRSTLKDGFFPAGPGNDAYNAWLDESLGKSLADSGIMGLAGQLKTQLGAIAGAGPGSMGTETKGPGNKDASSQDAKAIHADQHSLPNGDKR